jgi:hypothetical protein
MLAMVPAFSFTIFDDKIFLTEKINAQVSIFNQFKGALEEYSKCNPELSSMSSIIK